MTGQSSPDLLFWKHAVQSLLLHSILHWMVMYRSIFQSAKHYPGYDNLTFYYASNHNISRPLPTVVRSRRIRCIRCT